MNERRNSFRQSLDEWVAKTIVLSGSYTSHESFKPLTFFDGMEAVPWLLEYLRECQESSETAHLNPWAALEAICHFVPEEYLPFIDDEVAGKTDPVMAAFDEWGVRRKLIYLNPKKVGIKKPRCSNGAKS